MVLVDPIVAADSASKQMSEWFNHKPTKEQCEKYSATHTAIYMGRHFYLFNRRERNRLITLTLSSDNMHGSNIL